MKLRKPCIHDKYDQHYIGNPDEWHGWGICPGGVFLPDDTLVIEVVDLPKLVGDLNQLDNGPGVIREEDHQVFWNLIEMVRQAIDARALSVRDAE